MSAMSYYENNARRFFEETASLNLDHLYEPFLSYIPAAGWILDVGCGAGRDTKAFLKRGYHVHGFDSSPELVKLARKYAGPSISLSTFAEFESQETYHGIWACASLLHVKAASLGAVVAHLAKYLHEDGVFYLSFKEGQGEGLQGDRWFTYHTLETMGKFIEGETCLELVKLWRTADLRPAQSGSYWINCLAKKAPK